MVAVGFVINPIAGMGGKVGLKGTDGAKILRKAKELGAKPFANERAHATIKLLFEMNPQIRWLTCSGIMGEEVMMEVGFKKGEDYNVVYDTPEPTTSEDTKSACAKFAEMNADLILFCGGDGTARDIADIVEKEIPIIGIPSGVKMFSAVFGVNPRAAAQVVYGFVNGTFSASEAEIMDIDEEEYRKGNLIAKLFCYALTPYESTLVQSSKSVYAGSDEEFAKEDIAKYITELMKIEKDTLFILGAGSTMERIGKELEIDKTILGVDVVKDGKLVRKDVNEGQLMALLENEDKVVIIVSVIGSQGFVFGRGNSQISPEVLRKVGVDNIRIVATPNKLANTQSLRVDTQDPELDRMLSGFHKVIIGYHELRMVKVQTGQ